MKFKKGFTLIELLAVIVILAIILAISIPSITGLIKNTKKEAFKVDAAMLLKALNYKLMEEELELTNIKMDDIKEILNVDNANYKEISFLENDDNPFVTIIGQNKWEGLIVCGDNNQIILGNSKEPPLACHISSNLISKNKSNYYVGENPDNWIEFGKENGTPLLWRIIRSDNEGIKIIYEGKQKQNDLQPDENGHIKINNKHPVKWNENNNKWNNNLPIATSLTSWYQSLILKQDYLKPINWCVGPVPYASDMEEILKNQCKTQTLDNEVYQGRMLTPSTIGMINVSDYLSTSNNENCLGSYYDKCGESNFLKKDYYYWTLNANNWDQTSAHMVSEKGNIALGNFGNKNEIIAFFDINKTKLDPVIPNNSEDNVGEMDQFGENNEGIITQNGNNNNCTTTQVGNSNFSDTTQTNNSSATIMQTGSNNFFTLNQNNSWLDITQNGNGNSCETTLIYYNKNNKDNYGYIQAKTNEEGFGLQHILGGFQNANTLLEIISIIKEEPDDNFFNSRPVLNLKSDIPVISGNGTLTNPYKLK
jgi:prepilin-type N-terminal cleavage/methylation domain-containing protein